MIWQDEIERAYASYLQQEFKRSEKELTEEELKKLFSDEYHEFTVNQGESHSFAIQSIEQHIWDNFLDYFKEHHNEAYRAYKDGQ